MVWHGVDVQQLQLIHTQYTGSLVAQDMARSAKLDGFIKRGETEATVEVRASCVTAQHTHSVSCSPFTCHAVSQVELRNDEGRNHVIKRTLRKAPGTSKVASSWMLNGASASTRSVEDLVIGRLNIRGEMLLLLLLSLPCLPIIASLSHSHTVARSTLGGQ